jgi:hypothetical protein
MKVLKVKKCTNCSLGKMKIALESGGLFITCDSCGFRELLWKPGMIVEKLIHVLKREEIDESKLPVCLRKIIKDATLKPVEALE